MNPSSSTYDNILHCTRALLLKGGYNAFSYADISKEVGIRKASIHHHFPTKEKLVQSLVAGYREEAVLGIAELERLTPDPLQQLQGYLGYWEACIADSSAPFCVCALLAAQRPSLPESVAQEVNMHFRTLELWLESVLERGLRQGRLVLSAAPDIEAQALVATVHGAMLSARAHGDAGAFKRISTATLARLQA
ncbi:TetR/AcrR family transcriptional regulator [Alloalcanivorax sp. C16-2]|uniref:TetR/AcrR family transcriptional regulator n=1 Tax=Alloalcanivorax TaxID=3020832 RepID=UPI001933A934|nr:TetR/AcrR family transcriptional regulator [Alloalcanivorax marinus]MBL7249937.1 TetR/AcrR family transcriptional regulator [Alloalcanivorax marinus]